MALRGFLLFLFWMPAGLLPDLTAQMQVERLDRGAVAVFQEQGCYLSWRLLAGEPFNLGFNLYRNGQNINLNP